MVITGAAGTGKSTIRQRLAVHCPDVVALDVDNFDQFASVISPRHDYDEFWVSLMTIAHEIGQAGRPVVYCGVMLPEQVLANDDLVDLFSTVRFLALVCDDATLRDRITRRADRTPVVERIDVHLELNRKIRDAGAHDAVTLLDADAPRDDIEAAVANWIRSVLSSSP